MTGGVALSANSVRWPTAGGLTWLDGFNTSPDISPIIQELVDSQGCLAAGASIQLWVAGESADGGGVEIGYRDFAGNTGSPDTLATFSVTYETDILRNTPTPSPTPSPTPAGYGFVGNYYNDQTLSSVVLTRTDSTINFSWPNGRGPDSITLGTDHFSVRWSGYIFPRYTETYTFYARVDDGVRLWVNQQSLVDAWRDQGATTYSGTIPLTANTPYPLVMEYYEDAGEPVAKLEWQSESQTREVIPQDRVLATVAPIPPTTP